MSYLKSEGSPSFFHLEGTCSQRVRAVTGYGTRHCLWDHGLLGIRREAPYLEVSAVYFPRPQFATKKLIEGQHVWVWVAGTLDFL
jgi:hypothetical protein